MPKPDCSDAQKRFDDTYITSGDICDTYGVDRATVLAARRSGALPDAIEVGKGVIYLWERGSVAPHLFAWAATLRKSARA